MNSFYKIYCLENLFLVTLYHEYEQILEVYILSDIQNDIKEQENNIIEKILNDNPNYNGSIIFYNLEEVEANMRLAKFFGVSDSEMVNNPNLTSTFPQFFRPVCDTDKEDVSYKISFGCEKYDLIFMSIYFDYIFTTQQKYRVCNPQNMNYYKCLLDKCFPQKETDVLIYTADSGKILEAPNYNTRKYKVYKNMLYSGRHIDIQKLNEKKKDEDICGLAGILGCKMIQPPNTKIINVNDLAEIISSNVTEIINIYILFHQDIYQSNFRAKKLLLKQYPELVYEKNANAYEANVSPGSVRKDRLYITSTSASLSAKILCPYGSLDDIPAISFLYPSDRRAKELGIKQVNILDETRKFIYNNFSQEIIREKFDVIYNFFKSMEGLNFNGSERYKKKFGEIETKSISELEKPLLAIPYYYQDGSSSGCFAKFSIGGIHGAEYNKELYEHDVEIEKDKAKLFVKVKDGYRLNKRYTYTSSSVALHEDFVSFYPGLLMNLEAFVNQELKQDRYAAIFDLKEKYSNLAKNETDVTKINYYKQMKDAYKLIINSASGAADTNYDNEIRGNNKIISMRIIGQLIAYRIGQERTLQHNRIISTNTDGLYSVSQDGKFPSIANTSNVTLDRELVWLISRNSNCRIEMDLTADNQMGDRIISANGRTVGCQQGPSLDKSLAQPAIVDWALTEYLIVTGRNYKDLTFDGDFDMEICRNIIKSAFQKFSPVHLLLMTQMIISAEKNCLLYGENSEEKIVNLQKYNRGFILNDNANTLHIKEICLQKLTNDIIEKRKEKGERKQQHDLVALDIYKHLTKNARINSNYEIRRKKITNLHENCNVYIQNDSLFSMSEKEQNYILDNIDQEAYAKMVCNNFEQNWKNVHVHPNSLAHMLETIKETLQLKAQSNDVESIKRIYNFCIGKIDFI